MASALDTEAVALGPVPTTSTTWDWPEASWAAARGSLLPAHRIEPAARAATRGETTTAADQPARELLALVVIVITLVVVVLVAVLVLVVLVVLVLLVLVLVSLVVGVLTATRCARPGVTGRRIGTRVR